jgi:rhomboid protease GluP
MITLFEHLDREQADIFSLVLNAAGIGNRVIAADGGFCIKVPEARLNAAREAIDRYQLENPVSGEELAAATRRPTIGDFSGVAVALLLFVIHLAVTTSAAPQDYFAVFGADARRILGGEWYRCVTALLLHADAAHIVGNMAGVALFGGAVCGITGVGVGWLMILICGILGNLMNAYAYETGHLSVGASTAVFGAVGILCAIQAVNAVNTGKGWKRMFLVLGAGVALVGFLGTSGRSDVGAHLFGFATGVVMGGGYGVGMKRSVGGKGQVLSGTIAVCILLTAWVRGVTS